MSGSDKKILVLGLGNILLKDEGIEIGMIRPQTLFPFPDQAVADAAQAKSCSHVLSIEMNMGQMSREVKRVNMGRASVRTINRVDGQIVTPSEILKVIMQG